MSERPPRQTPDRSIPGWPIVVGIALILATAAVVIVTCATGHPS